MPPEDQSDVVVRIPKTMVAAVNRPATVAAAPELIPPSQKTASLVLTLEEAKGLRASLHPFVIRNQMSKDSPAVRLADQALAHFALRFEDGYFIPPGHYLDMIHGQLVPDGKYIQHISGEVVPVPEGMTYDRKTSQLRLILYCEEFRT